MKIGKIFSFSCILTDDIEYWQEYPLMQKYHSSQKWPCKNDLAKMTKSYLIQTIFIWNTVSIKQFTFDQFPPNNFHLNKSLLLCENPLGISFVQQKTGLSEYWNSLEYKDKRNYSEATFLFESTLRQLTNVNLKPQSHSLAFYRQNLLPNYCFTFLISHVRSKSQILNFIQNLSILKLVAMFPKQSFCTHLFIQIYLSKVFDKINQKSIIALYNNHFVK